MSLALVQIVTAIAATTTAATAVVVALRSDKRARTTLQVDVLMRLLNQFSSDEMHKSRAHAAHFLAKGQESSDIEDVFDFFETVALFVNRRVLYCSP
jgi:hypothetical protein